MLSALFRGAAAPEARGALDDPRWWGGASTSTWAGQSVTTRTALELPAVVGCVRLISDSISTLPIDAFRKSGDVAIEITKPRWLERPTVDLSFTEWCGQILTSLLLDGNAYFVVNRSASGAIIELVPIDPSTVTTMRDRGRVVYLHNGQRIPESVELVPLRGLMLPGCDVGLSPIEYARQSVGLGLATLQYGSQFFDGEGNMPGVIEMPTPAQPETMRSLAEQWRRKRSRAGKGLPGVLDQGATWKPTGVTNEQAQFLATRGYTAAEIAGQIFLVDPSDLGIPVEGSSLTYANLEQRNVRRVQVTFLPWIVRLEQALSGLLASPRYVKFNVSGLLRGDTATRWLAYSQAEVINASAATRGEQPVLNTREMRGLEDLGPQEVPQ